MLLFENIDIGPMNSEKTEKKCDYLIERLSEVNFSVSVFRNAIKILDDAKKEHKLAHGRQRNSQLVRLKSFRDLVKQKLVLALK